MSDRTVTVRLLALVGQFTSAMNQAAAATLPVQAAVDRTNKKIAASNTAMARSQSTAMNQLKQVRGVVLGLGIPLALGVSIKAFLDFEQKMAHVKSVADQFGRSDTGFKMLRDSALDTGVKFGFAATEVAAAQEALLKAGRSTSQVLGGELRSALVLAAAGTISLDEAAKITATTMTIFRDEHLEASVVADTFAKAANATVSGVSEMGSALSYVGPLAASLGVSFKDTVATISVFNQAGIDGERAGTNLRGMLTNLLSPSAQARDAMSKLGISFFETNAQGEQTFIGMRNLADMLKSKVGSLAGAAQAEMVGKLTTNASMPGFIVLMKGGAKVIEDMQIAIDASASAQDVAKDKLDSVTGALNKFGAAATSAGIKVGANFAPMLEGLANQLSGVATGFGNMGGAAQLGVLALGAQLLMARRVREGMLATRGSFGEARAAARIPMMPGFIGPRLPPAQEAARLAGGYGAIAGRVGYMSAQFGAATSMAGRFGAVASAGMRGLGSAMGGAIGFLGGPLGVALAAATIGFTIWQSKVEAAKNRANEYKSGLALLGSEYATFGTISAERTKSMLEENDTMRNLVNDSGRYKISIEDIARAGAGQEDATKRITDSLGDYRTNLSKTILFLQGTSGSLATTEKAMVAGLSIKPAKEDFWDSDRQNTIEKLQDAYETTTEAHDAFIKKFGDDVKIANAIKGIEKVNLGKALKEYGFSMESASQATIMMVDNLGIMSSQQAKFGERIEAMKGNVGNLTASFVLAASAQAMFTQATKEGLAQAFEPAAKPAKKPTTFAKAQLDPLTRQFDVATMQGAKQHAAMAAVAEASGKTIIDVFTATAVASKGSADQMGYAGLVATAAFAKQRDGAVKALEAVGMLPATARQVVDAYLAMPDEVALNVDAQGVQGALDDLDSIGAEIRTLPRGKVTIVADTHKAATDVAGLTGKVRAIPGTKKFRVDFEKPEDLQAALAALSTKLHPPKAVEIPVRPHVEWDKWKAPKLPSTGSSANALEYKMTAKQQEIVLQPKVNPTPPIPDTEVKVDPKLSPLPPIPPTTVPVKPFLSGSLYIPQQSVGIRPFLTGPIPSIPKSIAAPPRWGAVHTYGRGGINAMVGKGDLIRWAEPETGGEAYIPKKGDASRSRSILETAAGWYGLGVHKMALGGITSFAEGGLSRFTAPLGDYLSRYMSEPDTWSSRRTAALVHQRDAILDVKEAEKSLRAVQKDSKHTSLDLARAQNTLKDARAALTSANVQAGKAKMLPREAFKTAVDLGVKNTTTFIGNLNALANMGYGGLAMQLLQMGGPEAEAIAGGARNWPAATLKRVAGQVATSQKQQQTLENMPAMLAIRSAMKQGKGYGSLLGSGEFTGQQINSALALMEAELKKTPAGRAMLAAMHGNSQAALGALIRGYATGGIAPGGSLYRYAESSTGGEAVIPRLGGGGTAVLARAAAWHGKSLADDLGARRAQQARPVQVQISVVGEGTLGSMVEARIDGKLVRVAQAVTRGRSVRS